MRMCSRIGSACLCARLVRSPVLARITSACTSARSIPGVIPTRTGPVRPVVPGKMQESKLMGKIKQDYAYLAVRTLPFPSS